MFYTDPLIMYQLINEAYGDYLIEEKDMLDKNSNKVLTVKIFLVDEIGI